jgi:hypothetical protein
MPNGTQGLNAAQMAAMQANPGMRPVNMMHLQQQMPHGQPPSLQQQQQFFAIQQAQQQAQQQQAQQQAQQAQHAQQQANNGQSGQHTPQRASTQPPNMHEQSATPQSQHGGPPPGGGTPQPPQPPQPPSTQAPQAQGPPQGQPTPNPQPQQLPQAQQPGQQGQPGPQQQPPQNVQGQQGQQPGPQNQQLTPQEAQMKAQQHQNAIMLQQQQQQQRKNHAILTLHAYSEHLGNFQSRNEAQDLLYWQSFVERFYSPGGVLRQGVWNNSTGSKQFEIATPALARYYLTQFTSGISQVQMMVEGAREREAPNGGHYVEAPKCSFIYWFKNECQVHRLNTWSSFVSSLTCFPLAFYKWHPARAF